MRKYLIGGEFQFEDLVETQVKLIDKYNNEIVLNAGFPQFTLSIEDAYIMNCNINFPITREDFIKQINT